MADDFCLRSHPMYRHLFEGNAKPEIPEVIWNKPEGQFINSACGRYQVRKTGHPPTYTLYNIRIPRYARILKSQMKSFDEVKAWLKSAPTDAMPPIPVAPAGDAKVPCDISAAGSASNAAVTVPDGGSREP